MQKYGPTLLLSVSCVALCMITFLFLKIGSLKTTLDRIETEEQEQTREVMDELGEIKIQYQVEETKQCKQAISQLILRRAQIDLEIQELQEDKDMKCSVLENPSDEILNPQKYYQTMVDEQGNVIFK